MAALVQTFPQQTSAVAMISPRPSSSSGVQAHNSRNTPGQRYNGSTSGGYRGLPSVGPTAPYAFTSTPQLSGNTPLLRQGQNPHLRVENRTSSAPVIPQILPTNSTPAHANPRYSSQSSLSTSSSASSGQLRRSQDDAAIPTRRASNDAINRPMSTILSGSSNSNMGYTTISPVKPSPDRYHRGHRRFDTTSSLPDHLSGVGAVMPLGFGMGGATFNQTTQSNTQAAPQTYQSFRGHNFTAGTRTRATADDMSIARNNHTDLAKRYRRRSVGSLETAGLSHENGPQDTPSPHPNAFINPPARTDSQEWRQKAGSRRAIPAPSHAHSGSSESVNSSKSTQSSRPSSAKRDSPSATGLSGQAPVHVTLVNKQEVKLVNVPSRASEPSKRTTNPSPLSQPMAASPESPTSERPNTAEKASFSASKAQQAVNTSPAAQQLAELSKKDKSKPKSKLRRAFSFGSAAELRKASAQNNLEKNAAATSNTNKRSSKYEDELEPEQAAIAEKQEASGLGASIYSGQGNFFSGSTDNLSISSTASSASVMLRKMGKGVKKSTRSLVGLFRPKSVVGVPAADGPVVQPTTAQVSMVTVEAEREKVNVNLDPRDQAGGGTGFPKLERNSLDAVQVSGENIISSVDAQNARRSIVGGERERAEVLAAVKKGILKRTDSGQASPVPRARDNRMPDFNLPQIPHVNDSPRSSAPSTPADDHPPRSGHRRTDSVTIDDGDDYFSSIARFAAIEVKSAPLTPSGSNRNISFSPRIQFHDTWPSQEYDRRGEIATCNRLTPMLAQQIKEELNTFKMEMEVHESSKVYTHFF